MSYQLTRKEIVKEIMKSGKDPCYFINNYTKISHPLKGLIPFKTFDYQSELVESFMDHRFIIILKAAYSTKNGILVGTVGTPHGTPQDRHAPYRIKKYPPQNS